MDHDADLNYYRGWSHDLNMVLSSLFDISVGTVSNEINKMRNVFLDFYIDQIDWLSEQEWGSMRGNWYALEDDIALIEYIDLLYSLNVCITVSGYRHVHCIHRPVIVDNKDTLRYANSGFTGHKKMHNVGSICHQTDRKTDRFFISSQMRSLHTGPHSELEVPEDCVILADKIFPITDILY